MRICSDKTMTRVVVSVPQNDAKMMARFAQLTQAALNKLCTNASPLIFRRHGHRSESNADNLSERGVDNDRRERDVSDNRPGNFGHKRKCNRAVFSKLAHKHRFGSRGKCCCLHSGNCVHVGRAFFPYGDVFGPTCRCETVKHMTPKRMTVRKFRVVKVVN